MAIETYAGSGNFTQRYAFNNNGYFFTVGPKNGNKLHQPGTNGIVVTDATLETFTPTGPIISFGFRQNSSTSRWWPTVTSSIATGYGSMAYTSYSTGAQTIHKQSSTINTLGMDSFIMTSANSYDDATDSPFFIFPCKCNKSDYAINASRWGAKKVTGSIYLVNDNSSGTDSVRYVHVEDSVYKLEVYTIVTVQGGLSLLNVVSQFTNAYVPYMDNNATWQYVPMSILHTGTVAASSTTGLGYRLFGVESSRNILTRGNYFFPVFRVSDTSPMLYDIGFKVQTLFCFKAD